MLRVGILDNEIYNNGIGNLCNYKFCSMAEIVLSSNTIFEQINATTSAKPFAVVHCVSEDFQISRGVGGVAMLFK